MQQPHDHLSSYKVSLTILADGTKPLPETNKSMRPNENRQILPDFRTNCAHI